MPKTVKDMLDAANAEVPRISPKQAQAMIAEGNTLVVDLRDGTEVAATGKVAGAVNHSRGVLEFRADPASPSFDQRFDPSKNVIVYCAAGGRAALARKLLKEMG